MAAFLCMVACNLHAQDELLTAIAMGMIIWVAGGLAVLSVPNELMGTTQRVIHIVEILTQNAPGHHCGIIAAAQVRINACFVVENCRRQLVVGNSISN